jgi:hypothetical protein
VCLSLQSLFDPFHAEAVLGSNRSFGP